MIRAHPVCTACKCPLPLHRIWPAAVRSRPNQKTRLHQPLDLLKLPHRIVPLEPSRRRMIHLGGTRKHHPPPQRRVPLQISIPDLPAIIQGKQKLPTHLRNPRPPILPDRLPHRRRIPAQIIRQKQLPTRNPLQNRLLQLQQPIPAEYLGPRRQRRMLLILALDQNHHRQMPRILQRPPRQLTQRQIKRRSMTPTIDILNMQNLETRLRQMPCSIKRRQLRPSDPSKPRPHRIGKQTTPRVRKHIKLQLPQSAPRQLLAKPRMTVIPRIHRILPEFPDHPQHPRRWSQMIRIVTPDRLQLVQSQLLSPSQNRGKPRRKHQKTKQAQSYEFHQNPNEVENPLPYSAHHHRFSPNPSHLEKPAPHLTKSPPMIPVISPRSPARFL